MMSVLARGWRRARSSIAAQLYSSNTASLLAVLILAVASIHFARRTETAANYLYKSGMMELQIESRFEILFQRHRRLVQAAPAELDRPRLDASHVELLNADAQLQIILRDVGQDTMSVANRFVAIIRTDLSTLEEAGARVFELAHSFSQDEALRVSQGTYAETADRIERSLSEWRNAQLEMSNLELSRLSTAARALTGWVTGSALVALLLIGPVGLMIKYRILTRLHLLTAVMLRLSRSETSVKVPFVESADEIGRFARAVDVFKDNAIELANAHLHLDAAVNNMSQGLCMFDASGQLVLCNDRFTEIYKLPRGTIRPGMSLRDVFEQAVFVNSDGALSAKQLYDDYCEKRVKARNRTYQREFSDGRTIFVSQCAIHGGGWVDTHEDITERIKTDKQIVHMALHDSLTALPNRVQFQRKLEQTLSAKVDPFAVLCLDLDGFKNINDTLGHADGDELLKQVSERLRECAGQDGFVCRLGGDEFAVLCPNYHLPDQAAELALKAITVLSRPYDLGDHQAIVGASIGVAMFPDDGTDAGHLMKSADIAMYGAKSQGRGTFRFFEREMDARIKARRLLEMDLREAIERNQFEVYYQPIVNLERGRVSGFEALLRWPHPRRGMVSPAEFIPVAEETGLITRLGEWVLRRACLEAAGWPDRLRIAVNLSPVQIQGSNISQTVFSALAASRLDPVLLELEITETALLRDSRNVLDTLHSLKSFGVRISMDDFGTGYSSLSYLRSFPFDKIKIDQSFVRELGSSGGALPIIRAIAGLGRDLGVTTTAEGVESRDQLDILRAEGCTEAQGYLFSAAVPANEVPTLLGKLNAACLAAA
jgi:diguanylate cyclase (GGDEF)-like protein